VKDPDTGKRVSRSNPQSHWVTTDVPQLRIVDDELWNQVKARQADMGRATSNGDPKQFNRARRPKYLFSGLTKCAECGGGYVMYWRDRLACFGARSRGTCTNRLTLSRQEVEERVLVALREKLMRRDLFEDFCREYVRELNRLRMEHRAGLSSARTELATVEREIRKLVQAIKDGVSALSIKDELLSLEARKAELQSRLNAPEMPELLHPRLADVYREKVGSLCSALESEESRTGAVDALRALIETILLEPDGDELKILLKGDLAAMLNAARDSKRSPDTGDLLVQIKLVAGARHQPSPHERDAVPRRRLERRGVRQKPLRHFHRAAVVVHGRRPVRQRHGLGRAEERHADERRLVAEANRELARHVARSAGIRHPSHAREKRLAIGLGRRTGAGLSEREVEVGPSHPPIAVTDVDGLAHSRRRVQDVDPRLVADAEARKAGTRAADDDVQRVAVASHRDVAAALHQLHTHG
jgi:hypothetical protein